MLDDPTYYTVTDLKQFAYCGRIVYYEQCLPHLRPRTYKMDAGRDMHEQEQKRALRRTLQKYAVADGRRIFDLALTDQVLGLTGIIDEVVITAEDGGEAGEIFPVDYKLANKVGSNHRLQLAAYAHLLEEQYQPGVRTTIRRGFVYLIKPRRYVEVPITKRLRNHFTDLLQQVKETVAQERLPSPPTQRSRCVSCEFRRFCNDVV